MSVGPLGRNEVIPERARNDPMRIASVLNAQTDTEIPQDDTDDAVSVAASSTTSSTTSVESIARKRRSPGRPRLPCKKYSPEQAFWVWYHRKSAPAFCPCWLARPCRADCAFNSIVPQTSFGKETNSHRITGTDLGEGWDEVERKFQCQFGDKREKGGLQCKFYRLLEEFGVEKVRDQAKSGHRRRGDKIGKFGLVQRTARRYTWM